MRRFTLFVGWLVVVGLATTLTWQIVSAADDRVSERPIAPLNVAAPAVVDPSTTIGTTTTILEIPTTSTQASATATTVETPTTATSPSTTTAPAWQTRSVNTEGGTVTLSYRPGEVKYQAATPAPGFKVEVEKPGPPHVKVEFESESMKVELEASWEDNDLEVQISNEGHDE